VEGICCVSIIGADSGGGRDSLRYSGRRALKLKSSDARYPPCLSNTMDTSTFTIFHSIIRRNARSIPSVNPSSGPDRVIPSPDHLRLGRLRLAVLLRCLRIVFAPPMIWRWNCRLKFGILVSISLGIPCVISRSLRIEASAPMM
jgi:hypothetical protein